MSKKHYDIFFTHALAYSEDQIELESMGRITSDELLDFHDELKFSVNLSSLFPVHRESIDVENFIMESELKNIDKDYFDTVNEDVLYILNKRCVDALMKIR